MFAFLKHNTYRLTGLDIANGVATPSALIRCCIVGVADVNRDCTCPWI